MRSAGSLSVAHNDGTRGFGWLAIVPGFSDITRAGNTRAWSHRLQRGRPPLQQCAGGRAAHDAVHGAQQLQHARVVLAQPPQLQLDARQAHALDAVRLLSEREVNGK